MAYVDDGLVPEGLTLRPPDPPLISDEEDNTAANKQVPQSVVHLFVGIWNAITITFSLTIWKGEGLPAVLITGCPNYRMS